MANYDQPVAEMATGDESDREGAGLWRSEWLIALVPLVAWLFAYYYERGVFLEAEVPSALFDVSFTRMMAVSGEIAFPIAAVCFGASNVAQRISRKSRFGFFLFLAVCFGAGWTALRLTGNGSDALWRPSVITGGIAIGFLARTISGPGSLVARYWTSGYVRAYFVIVFCFFGGFLAQKLGQKIRSDQSVFAVLDRPCGPMIEVFRVHGDAVILVPIEFGPSRTALASLSALGAINVRFARRDEVRHRINFVGPCKPDKPESLGLINKP